MILGNEGTKNSKEEGSRMNDAMGVWLKDYSRH